MSAIVRPQKVQDRKTASYLLWMGFLFGVGGLHRLYNGKIASGLLWMCTWGFFGIGQLIDLLLIPDMAEQRHRKLFGDEPSNFDRQSVVAAEVSQDTLMVQLLRLAKLHSGQLTVTQAVMETGQSFETIESELKTMVKSGYADVTNRPDSGVVVYEFPELM
ncbi:MAG: TM2 domain-containing protein [Cyanobacteria bacterium P01_D01_bin.56]